MKLDRNITDDGRGKYGLINTRRLREFLDLVGDSRNAHNMTEVNAMKVREAIQLLEEEGVIDWGPAESESEFFVIKLRDRNAGAALASYALAAAIHDGEYAREVKELADRAGPRSPFCKDPD